MARGDVTIVVGVKEAGNLDAFRKLSADQQKLAVAFGKVAASGESASKGIGKAERGAQDSEKAATTASKAVYTLASRFTAMGVAAGGIAIATKAINAFTAAAEKATEQVMAFTSASIPLRALGVGDAEVQNVATFSAMHGVRPTEGIATYQAMYSLYGDRDMAYRASREAFQLQALKATPEGAQLAIQFGRDKGLTPEQSSTLALIAANNSVRDLTMMSEVISGMGAFDTAQFGAAAISAMSSSFTKERLREAAEAGGRALNDNVGPFSKNMSDVAKRFGMDYGGMGNAERLEFLRNVFGGSVNQNQLRSAGLMETEGARALSALIRNAPAAFDIQRQIQATPVGLEDETIVWMNDTSPKAAQYFYNRNRAAASEWAKLYGAPSEVLTAFDEQRQMVGAMAEATPLGGLVTDDSGRAGGKTTAVVMGLLKNLSVLPTIARSLEMSRSGAAKINTRAD